MSHFMYIFTNFQSCIPILCNKFRLGSSLNWYDVLYRWYLKCGLVLNYLYSILIWCIRELVLIQLNSAWFSTVTKQDCIKGYTPPSSLIPPHGIVSQIFLHHTNIFFPGIIWDLKENTDESKVENKWSNALVTSACLAGNLYVLLISGVNLWLLYWLPFLAVLRLAAIRCRMQCKKMRKQDGKEVFWLNACTILLVAIFWGRGKIKAKHQWQGEKSFP